MDEMSESPYPIFAGVEPFDAQRTPEAERAHRQRMCALGYRIFAAMRWGQLGDGHISARDPILTDHFWLLDWGVPFHQATVDQLVLVGPDGRRQPPGRIRRRGVRQERASRMSRPACPRARCRDR